MSSTLPQRSYFQQEYSLLSSKWKLSGHSRALERTGFLLIGEGIRIVLDAGVDIPDFSPPDLILVTHSHIDHCNALPMLYRLTSVKNLVHIFTPALVMNKLRQFVAMSFSIKVDDHAPIPENYQPPPVECQATSSYSSPIYSPWEENSHRWYPVTPGLTIPLQLGKKGSKEIEVKTVKLYHTISTIGYIVSEKKSKIRPDLHHPEDKKLTQKCVTEARARGEIVTIEVSVPLVAYLCDTTARVLYHSSHGQPYPVEERDYPHATMNRRDGGGCCDSIEDTSPSDLTTQEEEKGVERAKGEVNKVGNYDEDEILKLIFSSPIVMIECTYLEDSFAPEAERRGHVVWTFLRPILIQHFTSPLSEGTSHHSTFILIHFSLRYSDEDIVAFFMDPDRCLLPNPSQSPHLNSDISVAANNLSGSSGDTDWNIPPHLILWLDTGIIRLWYQF